MWGLQIERKIKRTNEYIVWSFWPRGESGGPSRYGHLSGIAAPQAGTNRFEILPYTVGQTANAARVDASNPFSKKTSSEVRVGADAKYLLTSNLTLSATINPDFGQVEADAAEVNLSAFESFFPEKRPFFNEGSQLFDAEGATYFYSRRIGSRPHGNVFNQATVGDPNSIGERGGAESSPSAMYRS